MGMLGERFALSLVLLHPILHRRLTTAHLPLCRKCCIATAKHTTLVVLHHAQLERRRILLILFAHGCYSLLQDTTIHECIARKLADGPPPFCQLSFLACLSGNHMRVGSQKLIGG